MPRISSLRLVVLFCLLASLTSLASERPNVLIVLVDDAGSGDLGAHGHPFLKTPNLDRLHGGSVRLTDFHVAPMCTPTRGQLLTGLDALRNAAASVTAGRAFLRPGLPTLPELLSARGYRTGIFGKWHLGDHYPHRPMDKGFQDAVWVKGWGFTSAPEFANTLFDGRCYRGAEETKFPGYITDFCFDEAMKWMRGRKEKSEPFFCYLPLHAVHAPHVVADKYAAPYQPKPAAKFFGMMANIDENMGRLESFLQETGLRENTLVIYLTDNGGTAGVRAFNAGLRGRKTEYYEGGHRVPCFLRWPAGNLNGGRDIDAPAQVQDLAPTLLSLCGLPKDGRPKFDGSDLTSLLRGESKLPDRMLVVQFGASPEVPTDPTKGRSCVIWKNWRLVHGTELYDVQADRAQTQDVATQNPEIVAKMKAHYETWWQGIEPQLGDFVTTSLGSEQEPVVQLTSADWQDLYADNSNHIRTGAGGPRGGPWNVAVERSGTYEVVLRRWPPELDLALNGTDGHEKTRAFPIAAAQLRVASQTLSTPVVPTAHEATFQVTLPAGRTQLQAWFQDAQAGDLCGAYYVKVTRLNPQK